MRCSRPAASPQQAPRLWAPHRNTAALAPDRNAPTAAAPAPATTCATNLPPRRNTAHALQRHHATTTQLAARRRSGIWPRFVRNTAVEPTSSTTPAATATPRNNANTITPLRPPTPPPRAGRHNWHERHLGGTAALHCYATAFNLNNTNCGSPLRTTTTLTLPVASKPPLLTCCHNNRLRQLHGQAR